MNIRIFKYSLVVINLVLSTLLYGQSEYDSLRFQMENASSQTKASAIIDLTHYFLSNQQYDSASFYGNQALFQSKTLENSLDEINALFLLSTIAIHKFELEKSIEYCEKAMDIMDKVTSESAKANIYDNLGTSYYYKGDYQNALDYWKQSLMFWEKTDSKEEVARLYMNLGVIHKNWAEYNVTIEYYKKALDIYRQLGNEGYLAQVLNNFGNLYFNSGLDYDIALDHYKRSLEILEKLDEKSQVANVLLSIGLVYEKKEEYAEALVNYNRSKVICDMIDDRSGSAQALSNIANIYLVQEKYMKALATFNQSLEIFESLGSKKEVALNNADIGRVFMKMEQYDNALEYLNKSLEIILKKDIKKELLDLYQEISQVYASKKEFNNAYTYYKLYSELNDSIFKSDYTNQMTEWQTRLKTREKDEQIIRQKLENQQKEEEIRKKNMIMYSSIGVIAIILVFSFLLYQQYTAKNKANVLLQEQNEEIKTQSEKIFEQNKEITDSIQYASRIQSAVLPPEQMIEEMLPEHFILYIPRDIVSGDFYWINKKDDLIYICAGDCTGHGVPGAFMSMLGISLLNEIVGKRYVNTASEILEELRNQVVTSLHQTGELGEAQDGMDMAFCIINQKEMKLQFSGAFNPLFLVREKQLMEFKGDKMPIGIHLRQDKHFTNNEVPIHKGDSIYIFSDGYCDQFGGPRRKKFMLNRFRNILIENQDKPMADQKEILLKAHNHWKADYEQIDDIIVFGMKL